MNFFLLGSSYFQKSLETLGHRVQWIPRADRDPHVPDLIRSAGRPPDAVILTDDLGGRVFPSGLAQVEVPLIHYGVDGPINFYWQKPYAPLFDRVLADQKPQAAELGRLIPGRVQWLPVAVDTALYVGPAEKKTNDVGFVGVVDARVRPKRSRLIDQVARRFKLAAAGGRKGAWVRPEEAARLYRTSRVVLNENLFPGVTTRMFEAMASGTLLMTEAGSPGLADLFESGTDLVEYTPDDLIAQLERYLADDPLRERIAARGQGKTLAAHDLVHRAAQLVQWIGDIEAPERIADPGLGALAEGKALMLAGLRWPAQQGEDRILRAERLLHKARSLGAADGESLYLLGVAAWTKGNGSGARARLAEGAALDHVPSKIGLDLIRRGDARRLEADDHEALARDLASAGHPLTPGFSRRRLPMVCWEAIEHYQAALSLDPGHRAARTGLADLLAQAGAWVEAEEILAGGPNANGEGADASVDPMKPGLRNGRAEALFAGRRS